MLHIIGLGIDHPVSLSQQSLAALQQADCVIGSQRQLASVAALHQQPSNVLPKLADLEQLINTFDIEKNELVILASGDPLLFGIGRWLTRQFNPLWLRFHPAPSSLQAACHRLKISFQDCQILSLHGRPPENIRSALKDHQTLLILTDQHSHPQRLAQECVAAGYHQAEITILSDMGYPQEQIQNFIAVDLSELDQKFPELQVSVIKTHGVSRCFPQFPGIPDEEFITGKAPGKGLITKREIRLAALTLLQPANGDTGWDIGAGCGALAVEWAYWNQQQTVYAIEHHSQRFQCLQQNQKRFGVSQNLKPLQRRAPEVLTDLPVANKIFIGGSDGELELLLKQCWQQLPVLSDQRSIIVASAVTEDSKHILLQFYQSLQQMSALSTDNKRYQTRCETLQLSVSRGEQLAGHMLYRPNLPVTLFSFEKIPFGESA
ncbi:MAG: precorrin-6y C5,15-methyltransferase (decarboxylating) subunit CbiE [Saccharospirillaceae bacterium]|nr:precorrin-6y C5,15-methyltransferase (decarboxylating) subunit CbiE [Saccharospirillaceae bacterium]